MLGLLISILVLVTLLVSFTITSLVLWGMGDWERHEWGIKLTLKIMWGSWFVLVTATVLTWVTKVGWHFRRLVPDRAPMALLKAIQAGIEPYAWAKTGWTSFSITVALVSLFGTAVLASVLLWIIGDWKEDEGALTLALKLIWGIWWVLCIATVLTRVAIFGVQRNRRMPPHGGPEPPTDEPNPPEPA